MRKVIVRSLIGMCAFGIVGCSALSGLTGSTTATPSNPTGEVATVKQTTLEVALPLHSAVAANCAAGDVNSCTQLSNYSTFCKETTTIAEPFKSCVSAGWPVN